MKKKVRLSFPYDWPLLRQTRGFLGEWGKYKFYLNEEPEGECDAWIVFNYLAFKEETTNCPADRIILMTPEPYSIQFYPTRFVNQFSHVITNQSQIKHNNINILHTGTPWFVNKSYDELVVLNENSVKKTKRISIITSNKLVTDGHKKRFEFVMKLKKYFNDEIDLFGRGINNFQDKWDVLAPYKYNISIENSHQDDYFTEKINDCFLSFTFPIYYGCKNLNKYYNPASFKEIDINNYDYSLRQIEDILNDKSHYNEHLNYIIESRDKYLNCYNIFPLIVSFLDKLDKSKIPSTRNKLFNSFFDIKTISEKVLYKLKIK
jgi:hypothetical protein